MFVHRGLDLEDGLDDDGACMLAGGPCVYTGRTMKVSHAGRGTTEADWDLTVKYVVEALDKLTAPRRRRASSSAP